MQYNDTISSIFVEQYCIKEYNVMSTNEIFSLQVRGRIKYLSLADELRKMIFAGRLVPSQKLPPVRELAFQLSVTPGTVARAYKLLVEEGRFEAVVGRGTFVRGGDNTIHSTQPDVLDLSTFVLPDCGQTGLIRQGFRNFADVAPDLDYLTYAHRSGSFKVRDAFCTFIGKAPIGPFDAEDMVITHGGQHAILSCLQALQKPNIRKVAVEEISYSGFQDAVDLVNLEVAKIGRDADGPRQDHFENVARSGLVNVFLTSSEIHNPTTETTTRERRLELARIADRYGINVIDDHCYRLNVPNAELFRAILPELGWVVMTPSKSISSALRVGCVVAPKNRSSEVSRAVLKTSCGVSAAIKHVTRYVLTHADCAGIERRISEKIDIYVQAALNHLGGATVKYKPSVPLMWVELPSGWRTTEFVQAAEKVGVVVDGADTFAVTGGQSPNAIRISVNAAFGLEVFNAAIEKLATLLRNPPEKIRV